MKTGYSSISLLAYNILPANKKLSLAYKFLVGRDDSQFEILLSEFVKNISDSEFKPTRRNSVIFLAKPIESGKIVNVLMARNEFHMNAESSKSLDLFVKNIFNSGMILTKFKCLKNKKLFPMRSYRAYRIINFGQCLVPIFGN